MSQFKPPLRRKVFAAFMFELMLLAFVILLILAFENADRIDKFLFFFIVIFFSLGLSFIVQRSTSASLSQIRDLETANAELKSSEKWIKGIAELNLVGIVVSDFYGGLHEANDLFLKMIGYSREDLESGKVNWRDITPKSLVVRDDLAIEELKRFGHTSAYEKEYIRKDGSRVPCILSYTMLDPKTTRVICCILDITDIKRTQRALRESEQRFRALFEKAGVGIAQIALDGQFQRVNTMFCSIFGYEESELLAHKFIDFTHPDDYKISLEVHAQILEGKVDRLAMQKRYLHKDGTLFWADVTITPIYNAEHQLQYTILVIQDITETLAVQEELRHAKEAADTANQAKSQFLANMSHEIRTPLTAIMGFSQLLKSGDLEAEQRHRYLDIILRNGSHLTRLIEDILDLAKVEVGRLSIAQNLTNIPNILEEVRGLFFKQAEAKGLAFETRVAPNVPPQLYTDPDRLRQILINIVGNAIKFTEYGAVTVHIALKNRSNEQATLVITVSDTGPGIAKNQQASLFQSFSQIDSTATRRHGGAGLGLALSKHLAQLLGGDLVLKESTPGHGSIFEATLQVNFLKGAAHDSPMLEDHLETPIFCSSRLNGVLILVVEDFLDNQELISHILCRNGAQIEIACNGEEALRKVHEQNFHIVLMDMQMPVMDGYEATRRLRQEGYKFPIIALTAHAMKKDRRRCLLVGCDDYLSKPVTPDSLVERIEALVFAS